MAGRISAQKGAACTPLLPGGVSSPERIASALMAPKLAAECIPRERCTLHHSRQGGFRARAESDAA